MQNEWHQPYDLLMNITILGLALCIHCWQDVDNKYYLFQKSVKFLFY